MPPPLLALAAAPALAKGALGLYQMFQNVGRADSTTPQDRERAANARQAQAAQLPGLSLYQARLAQGQNGAVQAAALGAGSATDLLAASAAANRVRQQGETQLSLQDQQYHAQANRQLDAVLAGDAERARADTLRAAQANAQLKGAGLNNLNNALTEAGSVAAYGALQGQGGAGLTAPGADSAYPPGNYNFDPSNPYMRRRSLYYGGFPT